LVRRWTPTSLNRDEFRRQYFAGIAAGAVAAEIEPRAISALYDGTAGTLVLRLRDQSTVVVPVSRCTELRQLEDDVLRSVRVTRSGYGLHWDSPDIHLAVPALINAVQGQR
jgi:hypothetical protein